MITQASVTAPWMRHAADGADVQIFDPPYAPKVHAKAISAGTGGVGVRRRDLGFACLTAELMLRTAYYASRVRRWTVVFCDRESTHLWRAAMALHGVEYVRTVPWVRWSQPQMSGDRPPTGAEDICVFHAPRVKGVRMRWNGPGSRIAYYADDVDAEPCARDVYTAKSLRGADKYSCEKPLDLMLALVSDYSDPGETVFDPTAGVGTTLVAAALLGRQAYGFDRSAEAAKRGAKRLRNAMGRIDQTTGIGDRDTERAVRWHDETVAEASAVRVPRSAAEQKTYERAQRRLRDCGILEEYAERAK